MISTTQSISNIGKQIVVNYQYCKTQDCVYLAVMLIRPVAQGQGQNAQGQGLDLQGQGQRQGHKLPQEATPTIETIYCATPWKCRCYDKRFRQFQKFAKFELGTVLPATPKEKFLFGVWTLVDSHPRVRFDLHSSIDFGDIYGFPKLGSINFYNGSPQRVRNGTIRFYGYNSLLVINCTRGRILNCFRDIAFDMSNIAWLSLLRLTPDGGVPLARSP